MEWHKGTELRYGDQTHVRREVRLCINMVEDRYEPIRKNDKPLEDMSRMQAAV